MRRRSWELLLVLGVGRALGIAVGIRFDDVKLLP
jgi:hypothetical protein